MNNITTELERAQGVVLTLRLYAELYGDVARLASSLYWADTFKAVGEFMGFTVHLQAGSAVWEVNDAPRESKESSVVEYTFPTMGGKMKLDGNELPNIHCWCLLGSRLVLPQHLQEFELIDMTTGTLEEDMRSFGVKTRFSKRPPQYVWVHTEKMRAYCDYRNATYRYAATHTATTVAETVLAAAHRLDRITYRETSQILTVEADRWLTDAELPLLTTVVHKPKK